MTKVWNEAGCSGVLNPTLFRKGTATNNCLENPERQRLMAIKMNHKVSTLERCYLVALKEVVCHKVSSILRSSWADKSKSHKSLPKTPKRSLNEGLCEFPDPEQETNKSCCLAQPLVSDLENANLHDYQPKLLYSQSENITPSTETLNSPELKILQGCFRVLQCDSL